jgi:hypothetical protein
MTAGCPSTSVQGYFVSTGVKKTDCAERSDPGTLRGRFDARREPYRVFRPVTTFSGNQLTGFRLIPEKNSPASLFSWSHPLRARCFTAGGNPGEGPPQKGTFCPRRPWPASGAPEFPVVHVREIHQQPVGGLQGKNVGLSPE